MSKAESRRRWEQSPQGKAADRRKKHEKRLEIKAAINALKARPCMDCGQTFDPVCMDFDHRDPSTKRKSVAWMIAHGMNAVLAEIEKCDLVCANCHRLRTHRSRDHKDVCAIARDRKPQPISPQLSLITPADRSSS